MQFKYYSFNCLKCIADNYLSITEIKFANHSFMFTLSKKHLKNTRTYRIKRKYFLRYSTNQCNNLIYIYNQINKHSMYHT